MRTFGLRLQFAAAAAIAIAALSAPAGAQANSGPVASNAYIIFHGLDWAWASPCNVGPSSCSSINLAGGGGGWSFATAAEWADRPSETDFLRPDGNAVAGQQNFACASGWFDLMYSHCDYTGTDDYVASGPGNGSTDGGAETWLVRESVVTTPEPSSIALLGTGLIGLVPMSRRKRK